MPWPFSGLSRRSVKALQWPSGEHAVAPLRFDSSPFYRWSRFAPTYALVLAYFQITLVSRMPVAAPSGKHGEPGVVAILGFGPEQAACRAPE
jgi:hypothetical protein